MMIGRVERRRMEQTQKKGILDLRLAIGERGESPFREINDLKQANGGSRRTENHKRVVKPNVKLFVIH